MIGTKASFSQPFTVSPLILVDERSPDLSYRLLHGLTEFGWKVLRITREPPERVRARYPLVGAEHYWLVPEGNGQSLSPFELKRIAGRIRLFLRRNPAAIISIEGIEFLMVMNGYVRVRDFLLQLRQVLRSDGGSCIVAIDTRTLTARELAELEDAFPMMRSAKGD